jgi:uncharacterized cupin superfamily protein
MEIHPGVFVSSISTDDWVPDEDRGEMHVLCEGVSVEAGLTRFTESTQPVEWTPPERETILVLEGAVRIEMTDGPTLELGVGDIASLPKGVRTTWHVRIPFKEFWVIA